MGFNKEFHRTLIGDKQNFRGNAFAINHDSKYFVVCTAHQIYRNLTLPHNWKSFKDILFSKIQENGSQNVDVFFKGKIVNVRMNPRPNQDIAYSDLKDCKNIPTKGLRVDSTNPTPNDRVKVVGWINRTDTEYEWYEMDARISQVGLTEFGFEFENSNDQAENGMSGSAVLKNGDAIGAFYWRSLDRRLNLAERLLL